MKDWEKFRSLRSVYLNVQIQRETLRGCPHCGSTVPTHIQIRAIVPPYVYKCECGQLWALIKQVPTRYDPALLSSDAVRATYAAERDRAKARGKPVLRPRDGAGSPAEPMTEAQLADARERLDAVSGQQTDPHGRRRGPG